LLFTPAKPEEAFLKALTEKPIYPSSLVTNMFSVRLKPDFIWSHQQDGAGSFIPKED
jgi:hypothetical protein